MNPLVRWFHQLGSPPSFDRFAARWTPWAYGLGLLVMAWGVYGALFVVPADYQQKDSFRILYVHVPSAWMSLAVYGLMGLYAAIALVWRIKLCEILAMACAPIGAGFTLITLATGSIWGKPMWGTWWVWDARLTSVLVLFFLWLGHAALVRAFDDPERGARMGAILALVGVVNLPVVKFSVDWWNTLHQPASVTRLDAPGMHVDMLYPLLVCGIGFSLAFAALVLAGTRAAVMERQLRTRQMAAARRAA